MGNGQVGRDTGGLREEITCRLRQAGFAAVGFARAERVDSAAMRRYDAWLAESMNAGMDYMRNHRAIREDPRLLLEGATTIISMAFDYATSIKRDPALPMISEYAFLPDYHDLLRQKIRRAGMDELLGAEGREWRICVDSAPIMERYWAQKAGVGRCCRNGMIAVPGCGSKVFLVEIITTIELEPTAEIGDELCNDCGACTRICPTGALQPDGRIDCNRCLSYLTIEHRGEWTDPRHVAAMATPQGRHTLFGCDRCLNACPLNSGAKPTGAPEGDLPGVRSLTAEDILHTEPAEIKARIKQSCLMRAKVEGLARNANNLSNL